MKRPWIWFVTAFAVGVASALRAACVPWVLAICVIAATAGIGWKIQKIRPICVLIAGALCGLCYTQAYHAVFQAPCMALADTSKSMIVEVTDFPTQYVSLALVLAAR